MQHIVVFCLPSLPAALQVSSKHQLLTILDLSMYNKFTQTHIHICVYIHKYTHTHVFVLIYDKKGVCDSKRNTVNDFCFGNQTK